LVDVVSPSTLLSVDLPLAPSAWLGHVPFALWLVEQTRPGMLVELGTHHGHSYFTFCAGVVANGLPTKCFAVDTWKGDEHAGSYGEEIFAQVSEKNQSQFHAFSRLLRTTFDEAVAHFGDGTIDILHIDGLHTYDAVKHDFETWLPKLSSRGVVLFHDSNVRERDFGVWRLWEELKDEHPSIEFQHSHGLGSLFVGSDQPQAVLDLVRKAESDPVRVAFKHVMARLGRSYELQAELRTHVGMLGEAHQRLTAAQHEAEDARRERDDIKAKLEAALQQRDSELAHIRTDVVQRIQAELQLRDERLDRLVNEQSALLSSSSWRMTAPFRLLARAAHRLTTTGANGKDSTSASR
jgi:O-antigen biosynthesis protein